MRELHSTSKTAAASLAFFFLLTFPVASQTLKISAFRDITAFVLEGGSGHFDNLDITYVANADEAHDDLRTQASDLVFMSYDDTLSMRLQDLYADIRAVMPVHGGILDLAGEIDIANNKTKIGIDTPTGYARALKLYLQSAYPGDFDKLEFDQVGATDLRYEELRQGHINATLLNPPFSYLPDAPRIVRMHDVIGAYQGVVVNANASWLQNSANAAMLEDFSASYYERIEFMRTNPQATISELVSFYGSKGVTEEVAAGIYARLWSEDGLAVNPLFDLPQLSGTESIFAIDSGIAVPDSRDWIASVPEPRVFSLFAMAVVIFALAKRACKSLFMT